MTTPFTASNGLTVQRLGLNRFRVRGPHGSDVERALIQGESTLRALVEYAGSIGITAPPSPCFSVLDSRTHPPSAFGGRYWMSCHETGPHSTHANRDTGATWTSDHEGADQL